MPNAPGFDETAENHSNPRGFFAGTPNRLLGEVLQRSQRHNRQIQGKTKQSARHSALKHGMNQ